MRCPEVHPLLGGYRDGELETALRASVRRHLDDCPGCRGELEELGRSLFALETAAAAPGPDLWGPLAARLAGAVSCREVEELLPAFAAQEVTGARATEVRCHL